MKISKKHSSKKIKEQTWLINTRIHEEGTEMPAIPNPSDLMEAARSANRKIEDRQWKQYQRYLARHKEKYGDPPDEAPISFAEFSAWLNMQD